MEGQESGGTGEWRDRRVEGQEGLIPHHRGSWGSLTTLWGSDPSFRTQLCASDERGLGLFSKS